jgi:ribose transport system ATP-binding protein
VREGQRPSHGATKRAASGVAQRAGGCAGRVWRRVFRREKPLISRESIVDASFSALPGQRAASGAAAPAAAPLRRWSERLVHSAPFIGPLLVFGLMVGVHPQTASPFGLDLLLAPAIALVLVALAQMFVIGIGAFAAVVSVISATVLVEHPARGAAALLGAMAGYGASAAAIQLRRIAAIVATLGASFVCTGIGYSPQPTPGGGSPEWLTAAFTWSIGGLPMAPFLIVLFTLVAMAIDRAPSATTPAR